MMRSIAIFACGLVAGALLLAGPVSSQEKKEEKDKHARYGREVPDPAEMAKMMEKWMAMATPGKYHERLRYFLGEWDTVTKTYWGEGPPAESKGKAVFEWLFEGRWMAQRTEGTVMGRPHRGFGLTGYDNFRNQYVGIWCDSMGTAMLSFTGGIDRTGKRIEMFGSMDEPGMDQVGKTVKYVTQIVGDDTFVFEIHDLDIIGGNTKVMEITYKRK